MSMHARYGIGPGLVLALLLGGCSDRSGINKPVDEVSPPAKSNLLTQFGSAGDPYFEAPPTFAELAIPTASVVEIPQRNEQAQLRFRSMREAALSWGSQAGYHRRMWELHLMVTERTDVLDTIFDFNRVTWPTPNGTGWIVPPVIRSSGEIWTGGENGQTAAAADAFFEIMTPGRIAGALPSWRDYLIHIPPSPRPVVAALRPYEEEILQWREWAAEGWNAGFKQADLAFESEMARLERDYQGMLEFRRLHAQGMISDVVLDTASYHLGAENDGQIMRIGERSVRIAEPSRLIGDSSTWQPRIVVTSRH